MKEKVLGSLIILFGLAICVYAYIELKPTKSFLDMSESEKKKFTLDAEKKINDIKNNPKLTTEEKNTAITSINVKNEQTLTEEEKKAMGDYYIKELQAGNIKLNLSTSDMGGVLRF